MSKRKKIEIKTEVPSYLVYGEVAPTRIREWIDYLEQEQEDHPDSTIAMVLEHDYDNATLYLEHTRDETDEEAQARVVGEHKAAIAALKRQEELKDKALDKKTIKIDKLKEKIRELEIEKGVYRDE